MRYGAARWPSRDESSVYGVGVYGPLLSYKSPCQVRELERGHPVMTVLFLESTIRFLDELLSFSRVLMAFVEWV